MDLGSVEPLLRSLKVLELGHYIAAPFATRLMAAPGLFNANYMKR